MNSLALLASTCGSAAAKTAALVEKRFAQSRQELLEHRHQELLRKQKQLQEQYTRLQQLSRGAHLSPSQLKKTGSENNIVRSVSLASAAAAAAANDDASSTTQATIMMMMQQRARASSTLPLSATVHGSLRNLANDTTMTSLGNGSIPVADGAVNGFTKVADGSVKSGQPTVHSSEVVTKKVFETDIL